MTDLMILVVVSGLAGGTIARLLTMEDGPYQILSRFHAFAEQLAEQKGARGELGKALSCVFCLSVWAAMIIFAACSLIPALTPLAGAVAAIGVAWTALGMQGKF